MSPSHHGKIFIVGALAALTYSALAAQAAPAQRPDAESARIVGHWTAERRAAAVPRDLVVDSRGLGYLRRSDRSLEPYGHDVAPLAGGTQTPRGKPVTGDTTPPAISALDPAAGMTIGAPYTFAATVTDASGIKSVSFRIQPAGGPAQSYTPSSGAGDTWTVSLNLAAGEYSWSVIAKDNGAKGGNTATSVSVPFTVQGGGGGGGGGGGSTVTDAEWTGGAVQTAAGRIYFEMPGNPKRKGPWVGYVCSGTSVTDSTSGRSVILTAAHCVYDDANKAYARNVLFIPNQAGTSGSGTDLNCSNDPLGCWTPNFGVVDVNWTTRTFPDNIPWDYAFYVVSDAGRHSGTSVGNAALDVTAGSLAIQFAPPTIGAYTHALGYSYSQDPDFRYCAQNMSTEGSDNWWLGSCELSGCSSGGPWLQPVNSGNGPVISVNSWGYTNSPGMAGPRLSGTSASCLFDLARSVNIGAVPTADGEAGQTVTCPSN
jgi:hypothetical protein